MSDILDCTSLRNVCPNRSFGNQAVCHRAVCCEFCVFDARDACWRFDDHCENLTLRVHSIAHSKSQTVRSRDSDACVAFAAHSKFLPGSVHEHCPMELLACRCVRRHSKAILLQWDKHANESKATCKMFGILSAGILLFQIIQLALINLWCYICIESYHSFSSGNAAPKSFPRR